MVSGDLPLQKYYKSSCQSVYLSSGTQYGKYLYEKSEVLLKELQLLTTELEHMKQMENGFLRLCSAYGILRILSPDFILQFEKNIPA